MSRPLVLVLQGVGGSSVSDAAEEMVRLSLLLGVVVQVEFNGSILLAFRDSTPESIEKAYWAGLKREEEYRRAEADTTDTRHAEAVTLAYDTLTTAMQAGGRDAIIAADLVLKHTE